MRINGFNVFIIAIASFLLCVVLVPPVKKLASKIGAIDLPNERKIHCVAMPRLGGLAMFASFIVCCMLFSRKSRAMAGILAGAVIIVIVGVMDDRKPMNAKLKMLLQFVAALVLIVWGGLKIDKFYLFGYRVILGYFSYPFTVLCVLSVINAINLIDGADGLASGVSLVYFASFIALSMLVNQISSIGSFLSVVMCGVLLGFLVFNFNPASIFMGDSGSMFIGYIISAVALLGYKTNAINDPLPMLTLVGVPLLDTLFAILRRLINKKPIFTPDKDHMHHQLIKLGLSPKQAVLVMYLIASVFSIAAIAYELKNVLIYSLSYAIIGIFIAVFVIKTDIIFKHKHKDK